MIYQGAISTDLFLEFLQERVLPNCEAFPGKRSVLVMDNASIHKDRRIQMACDDVGVLLQFLPPYSPDYNPIESTFKDLKTWIKANYFLAAEFKSFLDFLEFAIQQQAKREV
jgi:transposase